MAWVAAQHQHHLVDDDGHQDDVHPILPAQIAEKLDHVGTRRILFGDYHQGALSALNLLREWIEIRGAGFPAMIGLILLKG